MLRIFLKVHAFTFDSLNRMQQIRATSFIYWSFGKSPLFFLWCFGLSDFVSVIIREQKGLRKRDLSWKVSWSTIKISQKLISAWHDALHVLNNWQHTVQTIKCKGVNFEENSQHATSNIQALISTTPYQLILWYPLSFHRMMWVFLLFYRLDIHGVFFNYKLISRPN